MQEPVLESGILVTKSASGWKSRSDTVLTLYASREDESLGILFWAFLAGPERDGLYDWLTIVKSMAAQRRRNVSPLQAAADAAMAVATGDVRPAPRVARHARELRVTLQGSSEWLWDEFERYSHNVCRC